MANSAASRVGRVSRPCMTPGRRAFGWRRIANKRAPAVGSARLLAQRIFQGLRVAVVLPHPINQVHGDEDEHERAKRPKHVSLFVGARGAYHPTRGSARSSKTSASSESNAAIRFDAASFGDATLRMGALIGTPAHRVQASRS